MNTRLGRRLAAMPAMPSTSGLPALKPDDAVTVEICRRKAVADAAALGPAPVDTLARATYVMLPAKDIQGVRAAYTAQGRPEGRDMRIRQTSPTTCRVVFLGEAIDYPADGRLRVLASSV